MSTPSFATPEHFETLIQSAQRGLPQQVQKVAATVVVQVADWPPQDMLHDLQIDDPLDLTGLYDGIPLTQKSSLDQPTGPDVIWLFRQPILAEWRDRGNVDLGDLVAHVYVHELAHHLGWSDDDIAAIDRWWE